MINVKCNLDFFGAAGDPLIQALLNQSSNNRARKTAFNNLVRMAKAAKLVPKNEGVVYIYLGVNQAGTQQLCFLTAEQES